MGEASFFHQSGEIKHFLHPIGESTHFLSFSGMVYNKVNTRFATGQVLGFLLASRVDTASYKEFGNYPRKNSINIFASLNGNALIFQLIFWKWIEK